MKRGNLRTIKVYTKNDKGDKIIQYAVQVRLRMKQTWTQARDGDKILIFNEKKDADQVIIDYMDKIKRTMAEKLKDKDVKVKFNRRK
jgi:hypothetical protein